MTLDALIMFAGAVTVLVPFLGLPQRWGQALLFIVGACTIFFGILVRRRLARLHVSEKAEAYEER